MKNSITTLLITVSALFLGSCVKDMKIPSVFEGMEQIKDVNLNANDVGAALRLTADLRNVDNNVTDIGTGEVCEWCKVVIDKTLLKIVVETNKGFLSRTALVELFDRSQYTLDDPNRKPGMAFYVHQGCAIQVRLENDKELMSYAAGSLTIKAESNTDFDVDTGDADWLSVGKLSSSTVDGVTQTILQLTATENTTDKVRKAVLSFKTESAALKTLQVEQSVNPNIILTQTEYQIGEDGGILNIGLATKISYQVRTEADWLVNKGSTKQGNGNYTHKIEVKPLTEEASERTASVAFFNNTVEVVVSIRQTKSFHQEQDSISTTMGAIPNRPDKPFLKK